MSNLITARNGGKRHYDDVDGPDRNAPRIYESGAITTPVNVDKDRISSICSNKHSKGFLPKLTYAQHFVQAGIPTFTKRNTPTHDLPWVQQVANGTEDVAGEAYKADKFMINAIWKAIYRPSGVPVEDAPLEGGANEPQVSVGTAGLGTFRAVKATPGARAKLELPLVAASSNDSSAANNLFEGTGGRVTLVITEADEDLFAYRVLRAHAVILNNPQIWLQSQNDYYSPHPIFNAARQEQALFAAVGLSAVDYWLRAGVLQVVGAPGPVPNLDDDVLGALPPNELLALGPGGVGVASLESHEIVARMADLANVTSPTDSIRYNVSAAAQRRYKLYPLNLAQQVLYGSLQPYVSLEQQNAEFAPIQEMAGGANSYFEFGRKKGVGNMPEFAARYQGSDSLSGERVGAFAKVLMNAARRGYAAYAHGVEEEWTWSFGVFMSGNNPDLSGNAIITQYR